MTIYDYGFASRLVHGGDIGIAEAYLRGEWDTPDLTQFLYLFCVNQDWMQTMLAGTPLTRIVQIVRHWLNRNTRRQARRNIYAHYDIGNAFYSAWLDPSMTYSSALFEDDSAGPDRGAKQQIPAARRSDRSAARPEAAGNRLRLGRLCRVCRQDVRRQGRRPHHQQGAARFRASAHPGGRASATASRSGCRTIATSATSYDRIASIEMIEAVGEQFWPNYFSQLRDRLLPGGLAGIQAITIQDSLFQSYRREVDFIQRYVFPGGMLPSPQILKSLGERFGVPVIRERIFGQDYARTLAIWRSNFRAAWPQPDAVGFRRPLPAAVGILPRLLRGRIPVRKYRRAPGGVRQIRLRPLRRYRWLVCPAAVL